MSGRDWKDFWFENKWASSSLLIKKFSIKRYDYENFFKNKPDLRKIRDQNFYKNPSLAGDELLKIYDNAWAYYWDTCTDAINTKSNSFVSDCIKFKGTNLIDSDIGWMLNKRLLVRLPEMDAWRAKGFTTMAYFFMKLGKYSSALKEHNVIPDMFHSTSSRKTFQEAVDFCEHLYLYHYKEIKKSDSTRKKSAAQEQFFYLYKDTGFFDSQYGRDKGWSVRIPWDWTSVKDALKAKYAKELSLESDNNYNWHKDRYRKMFPDRELSRCAICGEKHPDLHHLLPREQFPHLTYHKENIQPLCSNSHRKITYNTSNRLREEYGLAVKEWLKAKEGQKLSAFNEILTKIHNN